MSKMKDIHNRLVRWTAWVLTAASLFGASSMLSACRKGGGQDEIRTDTSAGTGASIDPGEYTLPDGQPVTEPVERQPLDPSAIKAAEMPRLDITTVNKRGVTSTERYVSCSVTLSGCDAELAFDSQPASIRVRGNSTAAAPKKPYRLKFDTKQAMLGLNDGKAFKSWCLMADYYDSSMLRTYTTFRMADTLLDGTVFSADCAHVEVYLNGTYQGVYLLCDQTQINKNRVDIPKKEDGDTSVEIGYLLVGQGGRSNEPDSIVVHPNLTVKDRNGDTKSYGGMNFALSGGDFTEEQKQYVVRYVDGVFAVMRGALYEKKYYSLSRDGTLTTRRFPIGTTAAQKQEQTIAAVFNIDSAVALCILDELVKNLDAMTFNMYVDLSPGGDGRLTLAAPWDFDFSMANTHYTSTHTTSGFYATNLSPSDGVRVNLFYVMLGSVKWFEDKVRALWQEKLPGLLDDLDDLMIEGIRYDEAFDRDFNKWGLPSRRTLISHHDTSDLKSFKSHKDTVLFLHDWLEKRIRWLNRQWGDGKAEEALQSPLLLIDLTDPASAAYVAGFNSRCRGEITSEGLKLELNQPRDPYFYIDFSHLGQSFSAEDYPILEITYLIPKTNGLKQYEGEIYPLSGDVKRAQSGGSLPLSYAATSSGKVQTIRIDLEKTGIWSGEIRKLRIDFFNECKMGDVMYLLRVDLKTK